MDTGYSPNNGEYSIQLGTPTTDNDKNQSAPQLVQLVAGGVVIGHVIVDSGFITETNIANSIEAMTSILNGLAIEGFGYTSGAPNSSGLPQTPLFQRQRYLMGKGRATGTVTSTLTTDANLVFSIAPKVLQPGQPILLTGATAEIAHVSDSFVPSTSATTIPLRNPLVQAGNTTAAYDTFSATSVPNNNSINAFGVPLNAIFIGDPNSSSGTGRLLIGAGTDGLSTSNVLAVNGGTYNGSSIDRLRGNIDNITLLASAAHTTTQTVADQTNFNARGVVICVDTTVVPGSAPSNVVTINGKDPVSGKYQTLLTGAAITGVGTAFYTIYPGATPVANVTVSLPLPRTYQVVITSGNANSATYSVGASYIL